MVVEVLKLKFINSVCVRFVNISDPQFIRVEHSGVVRRSHCNQMRARSAAVNINALSLGLILCDDLQFLYSKDIGLRYSLKACTLNGSKVLSKRR